MYTVEARPGCRFYVNVEGVAQAVFTELSGLGLEMAVEDVEEGGENGHVHRLPGRCKVGNLTLKRGLTKSNDFLKWTMNVAQGTIQPKHVTVTLFNPDGTEAMHWSFTNAYPVKWTGPQFKADDTTVAIETVELAHSGFTLG
jgi:phage tail-like protein